MWIVEAKFDGKQWSAIVFCHSLISAEYTMKRMTHIDAPMRVRQYGKPALTGDMR